MSCWKMLKHLQQPSMTLFPLSAGANGCGIGISHSLDLWDGVNINVILVMHDSHPAPCAVPTVSAVRGASLRAMVIWRECWSYNLFVSRILLWI